jgi:hypothetical protein
MNDYNIKSCIRRVAALVAYAMIASTGRADITAEHNVGFNALGRNPYAPGPAFEITETYSLINDKLGPVNIPTVNADPLGAALEAFFGVDLPAVVKLQVGGTVAGHAKVEFGYSVSAGRLDINYPAVSNLNIQTVAGGNHVVAGHEFTIGSQFQPGVSPRVVTSQFLQTEGGAGYLSAPLLSFNNYEQPSFKTTAPHAQAWLDAEADIRAGLFSRVTALAGLQEWRKDFRFGGKVGGRLFEADLSGLYYLGNRVPFIDLDEPLGPFPIGGTAGDLTVWLPKLEATSSAPAGPVVRAQTLQPIARLTGNMEKLIPFVGGFLHNEIGPFEYDLLQLKGGPELSLYQKMTFTPRPQLELSFSEPVLVRGVPCDVDVICAGPGGLHETVKAKSALGSPLDWRPMFSNSSSISIKPTYHLENWFINETGLNVGLVTEVESLTLTAPFIPTDNHSVGPFIKQKVRTTLFEFPLFTPEFEIPVPSVTGDPIIVPKLNLGLETGVGDLTLLTSEFAGPDTEHAGYELYDLTFSRTVAGVSRQYHARVSGTVNHIDPEGIGAVTFRSRNDQNVVATNVETNQQISVGYSFCLNNCDLSILQPATSPAYVDPNPALGKLFITQLSTNPNIDINPTTHPQYYQYDAPAPVNTLTETEYGVEFVDKLNRPITTILARKYEFVPTGISEFDTLSAARILNNGDVVFQANLTAFAPETTTRGVYSGNASAKHTVARGGDAVPGGGRLPLDGSGWSVSSDTTNESGQVAIISNVIEDQSNVVVGQGLFRGGPDGLKTVARIGQAVPAGSGTLHQIFSPQMNDMGQVVFRASVTRPTSGTDIGIYLGDGNTLTKIYRDGDPAPGMSGIIENIHSDFALNDSGRVAFVGYTPSGASGLFVGSGGPLTKILATGDPAPFDHQFVNMYGPRQNNAGQIAVNATVVDSTGFNSFTGIYRTDGAATVRIVQERQLAPDGDGRFTGNGFSLIQINDAGQVLFDGLVDAPVDYFSLLLADGVDMRQIARRGMTSPNGVDTITNFNSPNLNNRGQVAFTVALTGVPGEDGGDGVMLFDGRNLIEVARFGHPMAGSTITGAFARGINDNMQVAYQVVLADGRRMIARFEPTLYWRGPNNGSWDAAANWSLGIEPFDPYTVNFEVDIATSLTGPSINRTIGSFNIGGDTSASARLNLQRGVNLKVINGTTVRTNGMLAGYGTMEGNVFNFSGVVAPGAPVGELEVDGDYSQSSRGTLMMEIGGPLPGVQFDLLSITGAADVAGTLEVDLVNDYAPVVGNSFTIMTYDAISGAFDSLSMPLLPNNYGWQLDYGETGLMLTVTAAELAGDADLDGDVDHADVARFAQHLGRSYLTAGYTTDADHDGGTTLADLALVQANLGQSIAPSAPVVGVPEPSTVLTLLIVAPAICFLRQRRRWHCAA